MTQKSLLATLLIVGCFSFLPGMVQAQGERGRALKNIPKPTKSPMPNKGAPFDGGISFLIAAGAVYTVKKAYEKKKKEALNGSV